MASRKRAPFKPSAKGPSSQKPSKPKRQDDLTELEVKVVGGIHENSPSNRKTKATFNGLITKLKLFLGADVERWSEPPTFANDQYKRYVKCKLKFSDATNKHTAFTTARKAWFSKVCQAGDPFWLESCEEVRKSYGFVAKAPRHSFEPVSCSLGSFFDRGTFVEHYNTENDRTSIDDNSLYAEFQHDTKVLEISYYQSDFLGNQVEYRLIFQYKQFEDYILVDEKHQGIVDIYIPLLRPPKVVKLEPLGVNDRREEIRCIGFLSCPRQVLGRSCVLKLKLESSQDPFGLITRLAKMSRTIYFCSVNTIKPTPPGQQPMKPRFSDFRTAYALECLLSRGFKVNDRISHGFYQMLREAALPNQQISSALNQLIAFVEANRFCPLETVLKQLLFGKFKKNVAIDLEIPRHYVYVPRIIITPTQDFLVQPELVAENRVIREYGHESAMRIAFREEDFSKLTSFSESLKDVLSIRVVSLLREGITLCGRRFQFLACSNSQLRDHGAWLYAHDGQQGAEEIRRSLGQLDGIRCVATYVSRMGQCFSSTKESVKVTIHEGVHVNEIPDITKDYTDEYFECCGNFRSGTYTFSDGIGKISQTLARKISKSLEFNNVPSAFQIRYAGCKGMLAIDKSLRGEILLYRNSMRKFDSRHNGLEICEHSKPNALYLNRQCITLLSGLGVPDEALIKLQDAMLVRLASMLLYENVALEALGQTSVPGGLKVKSLRNSGIMVTCEPFFRSLLLAIYKGKLNDLLRRARIAIPQAHGRLLIGVLDESQTLRYGQVFIRYSKDISEPNKEYVTLKGQVVVTKNPCFHPGDLRKFEAVDVECLHHLVDCIVFPSVGQRPHTDEISGSDLDGDKYFATWYRPLIPSQPNEKPMDFPSPQKRVLDRKVEVDDMIQFVAEYIQNDQLGVIANAHLVHADSEEEGVKSVKCIKLAHMHSDAVDFPKTGECPSLTQELRPQQYPDFMMKADKPRYKSKKILGKLFQKCNQLEKARNFTKNEETADPAEQLKVDEDLVIKGHEKYIQGALERRDRYNTKLGSLMALYGLKDEGEVLTGCLTRVNSRLSGKTDEKFEVAQLIQAHLASLRNNLKNDFYEEFGGEEEVKDYYIEEKEYPLDVLSKASAWYIVTYNPMYSQRLQEATSEEKDGMADEWSMSETPLLSFPWVVSSLLAHIKSQATMQSKQAGSGYTELQNISKLIVGQTKQMFFGEHLLEEMLEDFNTKQRLKSQLPDSYSMALLGASLTGLNIRDKKNQQVQVYYTSSSVPSNQQLTRWYAFGQAKNNYISTDPYEMRKSIYIYAHVMQAPLLLPILMVIVHWARKRYMTGSARDSFITVEDLAVLFIKFCEHSQFIKEIPADEMKSKEKEFLRDVLRSEMLWKSTVLQANDFNDDGFNVQPGMTLIKFWEFYGNDSGSDALHLCKIRNPVNPRERLIDVLPENIQRFTDAALHTFHEVAQRRGLDTLLKSVEHESLKEISETLTMPNCTWGSLRFAEDFVAHGLSTLTEAKINIRPAAKGGGYIMEVVGNYRSLSRCHVELQQLDSKTRGEFVYDHVVSSGNRFIFLNQLEDGDRVTVKLLKKGDFAVNLTSSIECTGQDEAKLLQALNEQLLVKEKCYLKCLHGSEDLHISLEYGSIFIANAHAWVTGCTVGEVERTLSKKANGCNRRNKNTTEMRFVELQKGGDSVISKLSSSSSQLENACHIKQEKMYIVELKVNNNHKLKVVLDNELQFKGYDFESFKWLDARLKFPRPVNARGSDVDLRIKVATTRKLETTEEYKNLPIFETFGKTAIMFLDPTNGQLAISREYRRRASHVYIVDVDTYSFTYNSSQIHLDVNKVNKYDAKRPLGYGFGKEYTSVKLYGEGIGDRAAAEFIRNLLSVGKIIKPSI